MRVRENDRVDRPAVEPKRVEVFAECGGVWSPVDEHRGAAVLDEDGVALTDVENAHGQRSRFRGGLRVAATSKCDEQCEGKNETLRVHVAKSDGIRLGRQERFALDRTNRLPDDSAPMSSPSDARG